jgi:hypothetical protein
MTNLAAAAASIPVQSRPSPVAGYEHVRGWGIYALPFDSGHVLAVRVFPESDFAPYRTVWHRTPGGEWAIYYDGPSADATCPRYYGPAAETVAPAEVSVRWPGAMDLRVEMDDPALDLSATMAEPAPFRAVNAVGAVVPERLRRTRGGLHAMEWVADAVLGLGDVSLSGATPSGHEATLLPRRLFPVATASARLDGEDLGRPSRAATNPRFGAIRLPRRPVLALGRAYFRIRDYEEYRETLVALRERGEV